VTGNAEDVMVREYLMFHKAIKEAADNFAFDDLRMRRELVTVVLCAHEIILQREVEDHPLPHFMAAELSHLLRFIRVDYSKQIIYQYIHKLEKQGVVEKIIPKSKIGKASKYVLTPLGDYIVMHVERHYKKAMKEEYDYSVVKTWV
jgi:hypothetical protein